MAEKRQNGSNGEFDIWGEKRKDLDLHRTQETLEVLSDMGH